MSKNGNFIEPVGGEEEDIHGALRKSVQYFFNKRLRRASMVELSIAWLTAFIPLSLYWVSDSRSDLGQRVIEGFYDPRFLGGMLIFFSEVFSCLLTGYSIVVGIYASRSGVYKEFLRPFLEETAPTDPIHSEFSKYIGRSSETFRAAQRRPNALLMVGTTIAMAGLLFFILTLPGFTLLSPGVAAPTASMNLEARLLELLPRLLMLIFIQVLAGFFLRQYRLSMEELKYFEAILRSREGQYLAYKILTDTQDAKVREFASLLLQDKERDLLRLQKGETTVTLEAQKLEMNEFKGIYDHLFDVLKKPLEKSANGKSS